MKKIIILHGLGGSSEENWFPWARMELEKKGFNVLVPNLSNSSKPDSNEWNEEIKKLIKDDEDVILIGHSLGGTAIYKLCEDKDIKIKKAIIIAAPFNDLGWKELRTYFQGIADHNVANIEECILMYSIDDPYVPLGHSTEYAKRINNSEIIMHEKMGHFNFKGMFLELIRIVER